LTGFDITGLPLGVSEEAAIKHAEAGRDKTALRALRTVPVGAISTWVENAQDMPSEHHHALS
jgi:hypothetical protein